MKTITFDYDEKAVCVDCGSNDGIQYSLTAFHRTENIYLDDSFGWGDIGIWCVDCESETTMVSHSKRIDMILDGYFD